MFYFSRWRFGRNRQHIDHAMAMIINQARQPVLYTSGQVADTVPGRLESILLHLCLYVHALRGQDVARRFIAELYRRMFRDHLDPAMRELAIGDLSVPKQMRKIAEGIHGRGIAYAEALSQGDNGALLVVLARNFNLDSPEWLAGYVRSQARHLAAVAPQDLMSGQWHFMTEDQHDRAA